MPFLGRKPVQGDELVWDWLQSQSSDEYSDPELGHLRDALVGPRGAELGHLMNEDESDEVSYSPCSYLRQGGGASASDNSVWQRAERPRPHTPECKLCHRRNINNDSVCGNCHQQFGLNLFESMFEMMLGGYKPTGDDAANCDLIVDGQRYEVKSKLITSKSFDSRSGVATLSGGDYTRALRSIEQGTHLILFAYSLDVDEHLVRIHHVYFGHNENGCWGPLPQSKRPACRADMDNNWRKRDVPKTGFCKHIGKYRDQKGSERIRIKADLNQMEDHTEKYPKILPFRIYELTETGKVRIEIDQSRMELQKK